MAIPQPRTPVCTKHHVWMAGCVDCHDQRVAERQAAQKRLDKAATT